MFCSPFLMTSASTVRNKYNREQFSNDHSHTFDSLENIHHSSYSTFIPLSIVMHLYCLLPAPVSDGGSHVQVNCPHPGARCKTNAKLLFWGLVGWESHTNVQILGFLRWPTSALYSFFRYYDRPDGVGSGWVNRQPSRGVGCKWVVAHSDWAMERGGNTVLGLTTKILLSFEYYLPCVCLSRHHSHHHTRVITILHIKSACLVKMHQ